MSELLHADITKAIIGAAFAVHSELGAGFLESIYENALSHELKAREMPFRRQVRVPIMYKQAVMGLHVIDLIVKEKVIVELKAVKDLHDAHVATAISYLAATKLSVALLINFSKERVHYKRLARTP